MLLASHGGSMRQRLPLTLTGEEIAKAGTMPPRKLIGLLPRLPQSGGMTPREHLMTLFQVHCCLFVDCEAE